MKHLDEIGETWSEHFKCASKFSLVLFGLSLICMIHAFIPCIFTTTTITRLETLIKEMKRCNED